ncbi:MAG: heterodisulfide reductase-related iron-sulfur binding cluster [Burkholderiaceae bacterium]
MERATFWYGCNVLRHGDIIHACIDLLKLVGIEAVPVGGPSYCCGTIKDSHPSAGDSMGRRTVERINQKENARLIAWCPSCHMQMDDFISKGYETRFDMQYVVAVLHERLDALREFLVKPVPLRVFLHRHVGFQDKVPVNRMVAEILAAIPGLHLVDDDYLAPGYMCHSLAPHPKAVRSMLEHTRGTVADARADAIVTIYHQCYRDLCGLERQGTAEVYNYIHLIARSVGIERPDDYKAWKNAGDEAPALIGEQRIAMMGGKASFEKLVLPELLKLPPE